MKSIARIAVFGLIGVFCAAGPGAVAGSHTWDVWEVFSNADKTVQFIELHETNGTNFETGLAGHIMTASPSNTQYTILHSVASPTALKSYLLGTAAFAALPGAPAPDEIIPPNFIKLATDISVSYPPWDTASWTLGSLPTDGLASLTRLVVGGPLVSATNSPKNYAGVTGTVDASGGGPLPGVPDGVTGSPMLVSKLASDGSSLSVSWDTGTCTDANNHQILFGQKSGFPALAGGNYTLQGGTCSIGSASPYTWTPTPDAGDGNGLIWFLLVTRNASGAEGPWGTYNGVSERNGTGAGGSSAVCATTSKSLAGTCGH